MEFLDINEYWRRVQRIEELVRLQPAALQSLDTDERAAIERYFIGGAQSGDIAEYRATLVKDDPTIELTADRAYNAFLAAAGVNETLTDSGDNYEADLNRDRAS